METAVESTGKRMKASMYTVRVRNRFSVLRDLDRYMRSICADRLLIGTATEYESLLTSY